MNTYSETSKTHTTCKMEKFVISHRANIECHSQLKFRGYSFVNCGTFTLAGQRWNIIYIPNARQSEAPFDIELLSPQTRSTIIIKQNICVSLVDPKRKSCKVAFASWNAVYYEQSTDEYSCPTNIKRNDLDISGYLEDDCLTFEFFIRAVKWSPIEVLERETKSYLSAPYSNLHENLGQLLVTGESADVTFEVCTDSDSIDDFIEIFIAHKDVLAARSPFLKAQLFGSTTKSGCDFVSVKDIDASVFRAVLHFIYTDELPLTNFSFKMTQKLFLVADRYKMEKLKQLCEDKLCADIYLEMSLDVLGWAEQHNCQPLKNACHQFLLPHA